jgi:glyoxylase-like metal-dependent hydrolase (beta-lactamase superfamily II)
MKVHHLNTGTMCPMAAKLVNGRGSLWHRGRMVCHVLLVETRDGLVLVDTGLGLGDIADPARLGRRWVRLAAPQLTPRETAAAQVEALGFSRSDVRHILLTHLDLDHAGGLPDFPRATVHVHAREYAAAVEAASKTRIPRYIAGHFAHGPRWQLHDRPGERWFGFDGVRPFSTRETEILLIPLHGHTPGHSGVAVRGQDGWFLHAGDAYFHHSQIETPSPPMPPALWWFQRRADTDRRQRVENQARLRTLHQVHGHEVVILNAHDPVHFDRCAAPKPQVADEASTT